MRGADLHCRAAPQSVKSRPAVPHYFLHDFSPFLFEFRAGFGLRWYGLAYVLSFLLGGWLYRWLARRGYTDLPEAQVGDFITWAAVFGVMLGGRLGWILFYGLKEDHSGDHWWWPVEVQKGGMASHGGILGLVLFTLYWSRRKKVSWTGIGDCLVVVAPLGLFIVRLANFINGELYGRAASVPWAMLFPDELGAQKPPLAMIQHDEATRAWLRETLTPRHPSQLYEALLEGVVLFTALWLLRTRCRVPRGVLTGAFFLLYALLRIAGEMFREPDPAWSWLGLSAGQTLSLFMFVIGAAFIVWGWRTRQYERIFLDAAERDRRTFENPSAQS